MLIEFFGENFGCFRDEFRLSLLATDIDPDSDRGIVLVKVSDDPEPLRLLRAVAIYGPNASGKSTILRAAAALRRAIAATRRLRSDARLPYYEPFALSPATREPTRLGLKAVINGQVYDYEITFDKKAFLSEKLDRWAADKTVTLFDRRGQEVTGLWKDDERFALIAKDFGPNKLLLSLADRFAPSLAGGVAAGLRRLLAGHDPLSSSEFAETVSAGIAKRVRDDPVFADWFRDQISAADVGVTDFRTEELRTIRRFSIDSGEFSEEPKIEEVEELEYEMTLLHRGVGESFSVPYRRESLGTQRFVDLSPLLFDLTHGTEPRAFFIDEMDASLHPKLFEGIIRHFNCELSARVHGQLIFAAHETLLLDQEARSAILRRDQVYLTEKDASGAARLYSVADFKERNNLNIRKRYLEGRYGAIPSTDRFPR